MKNKKGTLLHIAQLGVPLLRKKAVKVKKIDEKIQKLIDDMIATCKEVDGVGIAAPQVYQRLRILVVASHPSPRYPKAPKMKPFVLLNPRILSKSQETKKDWEGCLSVPGIRGFVPRYNSLNVEYTTREGKREKKKLNGFIARIFQHEFDHLQGKVFLERLESPKDIISEWIYQKKMKKLKKN